MSEMLSQLLTPPVLVLLAGAVVVIVFMYLLSIIWVIRDARQRSVSPVLWGIIAIIPVGGLVAYCLMRPPLTQDDQDELEMELNLLQRQLGDYGNCPHCGYPTKGDFVACPHCHKQLRNVCTRCGKVLEPDWTICPYCTTPVGAGRH